MSFNLATILTETALATPEAPVHLFGGTATTYRQLDEQSGRLAAIGKPDERLGEEVVAVVALRAETADEALDRLDPADRRRRRVRARCPRRLGRVEAWL